MAEGKQEFRFLRGVSAAPPTPLIQIFHVLQAAKSLKLELAVSGLPNRAYIKAPGTAVPLAFRMTTHEVSP
jgi:hypothetical protein